MIAPAARSFAAMAESRGTFAPSNDQEPARYILSAIIDDTIGLPTGGVHFVKCGDIVLDQYWDTMKRPGEIRSNWVMNYIDL